MIDEKLRYSVCSGAALGDAEWAEVSELFSSSYGFYSERDPSGRAERRIRLSPSYYRRVYATDAYRVAACREGEKLVAEAAFCVYETPRGQAVLVEQLGILPEGYEWLAFVFHE